MNPTTELMHASNNTAVSLVLAFGSSKILQYKPCPQYCRKMHEERDGDAAHSNNTACTLSGIKLFCLDGYECGDRV